MRLALLFLFLIFAGLVTPALADTTWVTAGNVSGDWTVENSPYMLLGGVTIPEGDTLIIHGGVRVFATGSYGFTVGGRFQVLGTAEDSVVFTCDTLQSPNGWRGTRNLATALPLDLRYAVFEFVGPSLNSAMYCTACSTRAAHCTFRYSMTGHGSALIGYQHAYAQFDSCFLGANMTGGGCGGVVNARDTSKVVLSGCEIEGSLSLDGGAFCMYNSRLILNGCTVRNNRGGVWGGVFYNEYGLVDAANCVFEGNYSATGGVYYGVSSDPRSQISFVGCQFIENSVMPNFSGAAIINPAATMTIDRCTFVRNGPGLGGVVYAHGMCVIRNSIFAFQIDQGAVHSGTNDLTIRYCDFYGNEGEDTWGTIPIGFGVQDCTNVNGDPCDRYRNIFLDPAFADTALDNYHLTEDSPCIDAGDPATPHDPDGTIADQGALYFEQETSVREPQPNTPQSPWLLENFPNPFNAVTSIAFAIPRAADIKLSVFDITGRLVATLASGWMEAGEHRIALNAESWPSGLYVYRLQGEDIDISRKMLLLK